MSSEGLLGIFDDVEFNGGVSSDDLFSILESLEGAPEFPLFDECLFGTTPKDVNDKTTRLVSQKSTSSSTPQDSETEVELASPICRKRRRKLFQPTSSSEEAVGQDGQQRILHITVERNRRKQMNMHLGVLRTLMPSFYVKRGDQASIIGGVVDYIKELQQVLQSLEAKKQRKVYSEVLSPRLVSSPRPIMATALSPRPLASSLSSPRPPLSPRRVSLPVSPRTPQPTSPYKPRLQHGYLSPTVSTTSHEPSATISTTPSFDSDIKELAANSKSSIADVEVKFSGANVLVKTTSLRNPGQALKIITALEGHSLEIIYVSISTTGDTMIISFTIKIGIECKLSAEELAHEIQQTFC
ncbi:Transcription factor speechless [Thalictrum thalictroides]|uniref:Transcription factor speechless n=1 Tax=Thalictrum thalictroides TaxID=46969 RepID=A0A7J6W0K2_THATH|nr:Transcription factor speechless [Thalictrum thalictroides]